MEENYQDSYFIINTALYAAEKYIYNNYNIATRATKVHEYFGDITEDTAYPEFNIHNLLAVYTDEGYTLPSIIYYNDTNKVYETSDGPFRIGSNTLDEVSAINLNLEYITGYIYPENARDTAIVPDGNDDWGSEVTRPSLSNPDGSPLYSPLSTSNTYYDLHVIGDEGSTIFINDIAGVVLDAKGVAITADVNPTSVINSDRIGKVTLTLADGINTFIIDARDTSDNVSATVTIVINKQAKFNDISVELLGKDLVTNDGNYKLILNSIPGSTININAVDEVTYSTGTDIIETSIITEGLNDINIIVTSPAGTVSRTLLTHVSYDSTLSDDYTQAINDASFNNMEMPQDMLMAVLMIANHYFRIALYKHEGTQSYGDNVSNRTTFFADRFPKEAHRILSKYIMY